MFASPLRFAAVTTQRSARHHSASPKKTKATQPSPTATRLPRAPAAPRPRPLKLHPTLKAFTPCRDCPSIQDQCEAALGYADERTRPVIERVLPHLPEAVHGVEVCLLSDDEDETAPCPTLAEFRLDFLPPAEPFSLDRRWPLSQRSWTRSRTPEASAVVTIARLASSFAKSPSPMTSFSPPCAVVPFLFTVIYGSCAICFVGVGAARGPWGNPSLCEWQAATGLGL